MFWVFFQFIFVFTFVDYKRSTYGEYTFPGWADGIGWTLAVLMVIPIPIVMLYKIGHADPYLSLSEVCNNSRISFCQRRKEIRFFLLRHTRLFGFSQ